MLCKGDSSRLFSLNKATVYTISMPKKVVQKYVDSPPNDGVQAFPVKGTV